MLKVYLSNIVTSDGIWLAFPLGNQERQAAMKFGDGGAIEIGAATSPLEGLKAHLEGMTLRPGQGIRELEFLDQHTEGMTEREKTIFQAALDIEKPNNLIETVNLSCNLDKFRIYEGAADHEQLGKCVLGNEEMSGRVALYLDYRAAGEKYDKSHAGCFTEHGYVDRTGEALKPVYDGKYVPTPGYDRSCVIQAFLYSPFYAAGHYNSYPVSLPASEERLALAVKNMGARELDECKVLDIRCPVPELESCLPFSRDIREMNELSRVLAEKGILEEAGKREKLFAALEAEMPENMAQAIAVATELEQYTVLPEDIRTADDYADVFLEEAQIYVDEEIQPFLDYERLGECKMRKDGVVQTEYGLVLRRDRSIAQLTENLEECRLFSPLKGIIYPYDEEWGGISNQAGEISSTELCLYEDKILEKPGQMHRGEKEPDPAADAP